MSVEDLLAELEAKGVELWGRADGRLGYRAPAGVLTEGDLKRIRLVRDDLLVTLTARDVAPIDSRPMTRAELRLWLYARGRGNMSAYNLSGSFRLRGTLDVGRLEQAVRMVTARHRALRSAADPVMPLMHTWGAARLDFRVIDMPGDASTAMTNHIIQTQADRTFDFTQAPLLRTVLLRFTPTHHIVTLVVHHLVADDESIRIIGQQVLKSYEDPSVFRTDESLTDAATAEARRLAGALAPIQVQQVENRRKKLAEAHLGELPAGNLSGDSFEMGSNSLTHFDGDVKGRWEEGRRRLGVTTQILVLALVALALCAADGPEECFIGMPDYGRETAEEWESVGYFATSLLIHLSVRHVATVNHLLSSVRDEVMQAQQVKHLQPEELVGDRAYAATGGSRLWLATYAEQSAPPLETLEVEFLPASAQVARHDLRVGIAVQDDGISVYVTHRPTAVDSAFLKCFTDALGRLVRDLPEKSSSIDDIIRLARSETESNVMKSAGNPMFDQTDTELLADIRKSRARRSGDSAGLDVVALTKPGSDVQPWPIPVFHARVPGVDLISWLDRAHDDVVKLLRDFGAVLVRGMAGTEEGFPRMVERVAGGPLLDYTNRSTPRHRVSGNVFTSTEYPADQSIQQHSEQAYATRWPLVLGFRCQTPPESGGETPLARGAEVLRRLPRDLVARFEEHGVMYERWYHPHVDLPWSEVFGTDDPAEVAAAAAAAGAEASWIEDDVLCTRQFAQAVITHPATGVRVWFNQAHLFHPATLATPVRHELRRTFGDRLPRTARFGDGTPIADEDIVLIHQAFAASCWCFAWQADDVLLLDNVAMTHGRKPFGGARNVLVAMAGMGGLDMQKVGD